VQEALQNVAKHSGASEATVQLSVHDDRIELAICDPGVGFPESAKGDASLGLISMRERCAGRGTPCGRIEAVAWNADSRGCSILYNQRRSYKRGESTQGGGLSVTGGGITRASSRIFPGLYARPLFGTASE
jgi:anti-sigma regulatory factor (Ser/Thr protein kinase)